MKHINITDSYRIGFFDGFNDNAPNTCTSNMTRDEYFTYCEGMDAGAKILDYEIKSVEARNDILKCNLNNAKSRIDWLCGELERTKLAHNDTIKRNNSLYEELCIVKENSSIPYATDEVMDSLIIKNRFELYESTGTNCSCRACEQRTFPAIRLIVCELCGNKRCPHASNHNNACTNSNDVGQIGSDWEHVTKKEQD